MEALLYEKGWMRGPDGLWWHASLDATARQHADAPRLAEAYGMQMAWDGKPQTQDEDDANAIAAEAIDAEHARKAAEAATVPTPAEVQAELDKPYTIDDARLAVAELAEQAKVAGSLVAADLPHIADWTPEQREEAAQRLFKTGYMGGK